MRAYELMAMVAKEPERYKDKIYKVINGFAVWAVPNCEPIYFEKVYIKGRGLCGVDESGYKTGSMVSVYDDTEVMEIAQPVPFMEAVKAYKDGKTISCKIQDAQLTYARNQDRERCHYGYKLINTLDYAVNTDEILEGIWTIEE
jgi:hypothetical protein